MGGYEQVEEAYLGVLRSSNWLILGIKARADIMRAMAGFFMQLGLLKGARSVVMYWSISHVPIIAHSFRQSCAENFRMIGVFGIMINVSAQNCFL